MPQPWCPFCGGAEWRYVVAGEGRFNAECRSCSRVVEERHSLVEEIFVERAHDAPLCIVTPDFNENDAYRAPPIEDDPFESIGLITAFSTLSLERAPLYAVTTATMSGQLAEMERTLADTLYNGGGVGPVSVSGSNNNMLDILRGYLEILEVSSVLGLERDICDHGYELFRDCLQQTYLRNRNIEALALAALIQAMREGGEPRTLQEVSQASSIPQKEIGRHIKILSDALKLSQPLNSNSISVHMPRFCSLLQLSQSTQKLATHIGEVVLDKSFCTRRNPISISAAAIYLACHLEDKRKTQTEICKATGLTEVTLRKVYKELLENLDDLLPSDYTPAVPLEKAFSVNTASSLRVHVQRQATGVSGLSDPSITTTPYNSAVSNNSVGLAGDTSSAVGGSGASSPTQPNMVRVPVSAASANANDRATAVPYRGSTPPSDGRAAGMHMFAVPNQVSAVSNGVENLERSRPEAAKELERERSDRDREKERDRERSEQPSEYAGLKKVNMMPPASMAGFRPSFFPFHVDPRVLHEVWPLQLYGTAMRPEETTAAATRGNDRSREDGGVPSSAAQPNLKANPQYVGVFPGMAENMSNPSMQLKMLQLMQSTRPTDTGERQATPIDRERDVDSDRDNESSDPVETPTHNGSNLPTNSAASTTLSVFAAAAAASQGRPGPPVFPGFPPALWPFMSANGGPGPYGLFPPQLIPGGGMPQPMVQGMSQGGENHSSVSDKTVGNHMVLDGLPHGLLTPAGAEALARMAPGVVSGQAGLPHGLLASAGAADVLARMGPGAVQGQAGGLGGQSNMMWPGAQFHQLFLPQGMISGVGGPVPAPGSSNGPSEGLNGIKRDNVGGNPDGNVRSSTTGPNTHLSQRSVTELFPMLGMGGNHGVPPGHPSSTPSNRADNSETMATSAGTVSQSTYERQLPHAQH